MPSIAPVEGRRKEELVERLSETDGSASDSDASSSASNSERDATDSDALDSVSPRKRRRTSPAVHDDHRDDDEPKVIKSVINVPSRIKRSQSQAESKATAARPSDTEAEPASRTTAPLDANTTFESLGVRPWLVQSLANMAIKRPTAIQRESIPMLLKGRDCIGGSRTGSGKTVAFSVPILQKWAENPSAIFGLILTPTRWVPFPVLAYAMHCMTDPC
jgi:ATP-dependent RNA helicase DDX49/DBP8